MTTDDLGLFCTEAVSDDSFALDVDQLVLKDQLLCDQNWKLLGDSFTLFEGCKIVNAEFHITIYEKFSFLEYCMPDFRLLAERTYIKYLEFLCAPFCKSSLRAKRVQESILNCKHYDVGLMDIPSGFVFLVSWAGPHGADMQAGLKTENQNCVGASQEY